LLLLPARLAAQRDFCAIPLQSCKTCHQGNSCLPEGLREDMVLASSFFRNNDLQQH
jgi:hypothetical protein